MRDDQELRFLRQVMRLDVKPEATMARWWGPGLALATAFALAMLWFAGSRWPTILIVLCSAWVGFVSGAGLLILRAQPGWRLVASYADIPRIRSRIAELES